MIFKLELKDVKIIGYFIGKLLMGLAGIMLIPLLVALLSREINPAMDFAIAILISLSAGIVLEILCKSDEELNWMHGLSTAAMIWLFAMIIGAIPLFLSGHFSSFLDSLFDSMSGFATTGLSLINNLDHASNGLNMWRHLIMFLGGQGIIVVALTFLIKGTAGAYRMYIGEAREEKIMPNVVQTARFIWIVSLSYLVLGTLAMTIVGLREGLPLMRAFLHGMWLFMAAFDTGGFAPQSQSILYYHSFPYELTTIFLMFLGAINFGLHYAILNGNRKEIFKNIESIILTLSIFVTFTISAVALAKFQAYESSLTLFRKGFYQIISAHTGTGFMSVYGSEFLSRWSALSLFGVIIAMALGASVCSTAGGIKILRVGIIMKALRQDIKRIITPGSAVVVEKFHHIKDIVLEEKMVRNTIIITIIYILTYFIGTLIAMFYGYPLKESLFESISATANVGLTTGLTTPSMPSFLKITYIIQMWLGRLEFISIFALLGFLFAGIFKKKRSHE